jgi:hypothetical protein
MNLHRKEGNTFIEIFSQKLLLSAPGDVGGDQQPLQSAL